MYTLHDTFNDHPISRHRSIVAAVRAMRRHAAAVRRRNGPNAFIVYMITDAAEELVPPQEIETAEHELDMKRR